VRERVRRGCRLTESPPIVRHDAGPVGQRWCNVHPASPICNSGVQQHDDWPIASPALPDELRTTPPD